jgi:hypothetical protein
MPREFMQHQQHTFCSGAFHRPEPAFAQVIATDER